MPWLPELFTAPALQRILDERRRDALVAVPYFDGLLAGDPDPLVESFAGEPELHDPVRGRIKGVAAFRAFVTETSAWLRQHHASGRRRRARHPRAARLRGGGRSTSTPTAAPSTCRSPSSPSAQPDGRIDELRVYFDHRAAHRPATRTAHPCSSPTPTCPCRTPWPTYLRALAAGDVDAIVAAFEPDGYARERPAGASTGSGRPARLLRAAVLQSGGIPLEPARSSTTGALRPGVQRRAGRGCAAAARRRTGIGGSPRSVRQSIRRAH